MHCVTILLALSVAMLTDSLRPMTYAEAPEATWNFHR